jgi:Icc protein
MLIAQLSDLHVGEEQFDALLLDTAIDEINQASPDLVAVAGDLTGSGSREQFYAASMHLGRLACPAVVLVPGNHDAQDAGDLHYEDVFGDRNRVVALATDLGRVRVICVDSTVPDMDDGEIGRELYPWLLEALEAPADCRILVMHHHLVAVPGTGRDRDTVGDAGDLLEILRTLGVDLVLAGHRHVPHVWPVAGFFVVHSGAVSSRRVRGFAQPSYNLIHLSADQLEVRLQTPSGPTEILARYELPYGPEGRQRAVEATKLIRSGKRGGTDFRRPRSSNTAGPRVDPHSSS